MRRALKEKFLKLQPIEIKVRACTNNDPWDTKPDDMKEIAVATQDSSQYTLLFPMLWKRLTDIEQPTHVSKALSLSLYLLRNGSMRFHRDAKMRQKQIVELKTYTIYDEDKINIQAAIRHKATVMLNLINDDEGLQAERKKHAEIAARGALSSQTYSSADFAHENHSSNNKGSGESKTNPNNYQRRPRKATMEVSVTVSDDDEAEGKDPFAEFTQRNKSRAALPQKSAVQPITPSAPVVDPFGTASAFGEPQPKPVDPFAPAPSTTVDPFASSTTSSVDPFASSGSSADPFGVFGGSTATPNNPTPTPTATVDPFAAHTPASVAAPQQNNDSTANPFANLTSTPAPSTQSTANIFDIFNTVPNSNPRSRSNSITALTGPGNLGDIVKANANRPPLPQHPNTNNNNLNPFANMGMNMNNNLNNGNNFNPMMGGNGNNNMNGGFPGNNMNLGNQGFNNRGMNPNMNPNAQQRPQGNINMNPMMNMGMNNNFNNNNMMNLNNTMNNMTLSRTGPTNTAPLSSNTSKNNQSFGDLNPFAM